MYLDFTKMSSEFALSLRSEILIAEEDDSALRDEKGELVALLVVEL